MVQYERGDDGQLHLLMSDTAKRDWYDTVKRVERGDEKRKISTTSRAVLTGILPKQILLSFPNWFKPLEPQEVGVDVTAELVKQSVDKAEQSPWLEDLVARLHHMATSTVAERRDEVNPFRANNTMGALICAAGVILDQEKMLGMRLRSDENAPIAVTPQNLGRKFEEWIGDNNYFLVADRVLQLLSLVREKKDLGKRNTIARQKILKLAKSERTIPLELIEEKSLTDLQMLIPIEQVRQIYKVGELCLAFLNSNDERIGEKIPDDFMGQLLGVVLA